MIRLDGASLSFEDKQVFSGVTLHAAPGEHIAFMGPSGCGKTSLLRLAAGLIRPTAGTVSSNAKRLAYAFQEPRLLPRRTALENVNAVLSDGEATLPLARQWLGAVGLADAADKLPMELSGGMRQRVNLARAMAYDGDLLLLDEPLKELDGQRRADILALLEEHCAGRTVLLTTHDREAARTLAGRLYVFQEGTFLPGG